MGKLYKLNSEVLNLKSNFIKSVGEDLKSTSEVFKQKVQSIVERIGNKNSFETQKIIAEELNFFVIKF